MAGDPDSDIAANGSDQGRRAPLSRLVGAGAKAGERIAHATGIDDTIDDIAEEAIVRALQSPAVERAVVRLLHHNAVQDALAETLTSDEVAEAIIAAIESPAGDQVWGELLSSNKAQMLVERIAESPEIRSAIAQQGAGFVTDLGAHLTVVTENIDDHLERVIAGAQHDSETDQVGLVTRAAAAATDALIASAVYSLCATIVAAVVPFATGERLSTPVAIVLVVLGALAAGTVIVSCWALAGQTLGMRFLSIRLETSDGDTEIGLKVAIRRFFALLLAILPLGLGLLAIMRDPQRRGWHDRIAGTEVVYDDMRRFAPHSRRPAKGKSATERAA